MDHDYVVVSDGRIVMVAGFNRATKIASGHVAAGARVLVKLASKADQVQYLRSLRRYYASL
jgi:hypothetical protein